MSARWGANGDRAVSSVSWLAACLLLTGCSVARDLSQTPRTSMEQLLLAQSIERSLSDAVVPLPASAAISVETSGLTGDKEFAQAVVAHWLNRQGLRLHAEGPYVAHLLVQALGTEQHVNFFGMPAVQSVLIPIALPELTLYRSVRQRGYARLTLDVREKDTGRLIASSPVHEGSVYYHHYTILFWFAFDSTDLLPPPL